MPSIRTFKIFLAVAAHGTFAAAGKQIGLTAAAVGLQIKAFEEELNCTLFDRSARAAVLNPAGRALVPELQDLLRRYEALVARTGGDGMSGTVVIGALVSALMGAFSNALWSLRQQHPRLDVRLIAGMSDEFSRKVASGELDGAIVTQSPHALASNLRWTPLYSEPMQLIVPRRALFALEGSAQELAASAPFLRFARQTWTGELVQQVIDQADLKVSESMELNSVEAIVDLVRQGFGVSIVPRLANVDWGRDRALRVLKLPGVQVERRVGLLERSQHSREAFTEAIKAYFERARTAAR